MGEYTMLEFGTVLGVVCFAVLALNIGYCLFDNE